MKKFLFVACVAMISTLSAQPYYGAKFEPESGIIVGAGASDKFSDKNDYTKSWSDFVAATGLAAPVYGDFMELGWGASLIKSWGTNLKAKIPAGCIPQIGMSFTGAGIFNPSKNITKDIIAGKYDSDINVYADQLIALKRKVFLRVGLEFDLKSYGYLSTDWKGAYRRVVDLMRKRTDSIAFVFCSAGMAGNGSWGAPSQLDKYWPGDNYVDWCGIDFLQGMKEFNEPVRIKAFMDYAAKHKKPVMIGELAPVDIQARTWNAWFPAFFAILAKYPIIKSFTYINWDWNAEAKKRHTDWNWGDSRLQGSVAKLFGAGIKALSAIQYFDTAIIKIPITIPVTKYIIVQRLDTIGRYIIVDTIGFKDSAVITPRADSLQHDKPSNIAIGYSTLLYNTSGNTETSSVHLGEAALLERIPEILNRKRAK